MKSLSTIALMFLIVFILGACSSASRDIASSYCDSHWSDAPSKKSQTYKCQNY